MLKNELALTWINTENSYNLYIPYSWYVFPYNYNSFWDPVTQNYYYTLIIYRIAIGYKFKNFLILAGIQTAHVLGASVNAIDKYNFDVGFSSDLLYKAIPFFIQGVDLEINYEISKKWMIGIKDSEIIFGFNNNFIPTHCYLNSIKFSVSRISF